MMQSLLSPALTVDQYTIAMTTMGGWFAAVESTCFGTWADLIFVPHKAELIMQDLKSLGHYETLRKAKLQFPANINRAFALGVLYVCEGSTLGGLIIGPRVSRALQRDDVTRYYQCYGENTRQHWQLILNLLDQHLQTSEDLAQAIEGAQWAFNTLIAEVERAQSDPSGENICLSA